jgi:formylglycine-generating enzyme required for sulfatase activity
MKKRLLYKILNVLLLLVLFVSIAEAGNNRAIKVVSSFDGKTLQSKYGGDNHAVIIGINKYANHPDLDTAVKDASEVASILEEKYFFKKENIMLLTDEKATRKNIIKKFEDLITLKVNQGDNVFIYYAGHGWFDKTFEIGYWVTTEATKDKTTFLQNNTVYQTISALNKRKVKHIFLVSDSCFSGNFIRKHRDIETDINDDYFYQYYSRPSRNILTSGGDEVVSDQGKDGHSVFAYYFLQQLRNNSFPYISVKQLGYEVEKMVTRNSNQKPISKFLHGVGDEDGQFFFINKYSMNNNQKRQYETFNLPDDKEASFDDLFDKANSKKRAVAKWTAWQSKKNIKFEQLKEIENNRLLSSEDTLIAWKRFLKDISEQNPFSNEDDHMRAYAKQKITYWENHENETMGTFTNRLGMTFVLIKAGRFMMGSPSNEPDRGSDEKQHEVILTKDFYMQTTEVTQRQWKAVMGNNPSYFKACGENCPVEQVSWENSQEFINKINQMGDGYYRLPTEAEWEYAARAGSTTSYYYGNKARCERMNFENDPGSSETKCVDYIKSRQLPVDSTIPVKSYPSNKFGLYDMHGNVWEWCSDWYGDYPDTSVTDPGGPSGGSSRVGRGGGWTSNARYCRSAYRNNDSPGTRYYYIGLRLMRALYILIFFLLKISS